jgi:hypothetical protein
MLQKYTMLHNFIQNFIENKCFNIKKVNHNNYEIDCFICFMPYEQNNPIKMLSDFSHIIQKCKCNAKIHLTCLNNWIQKTQSCPICRTKCTSLQQSNLRKYYVIINIYLFILLTYNILVCLIILKHILFHLYLSITL